MLSDISNGSRELTLTAAIPSRRKFRPVDRPPTDGNVGNLDQFTREVKDPKGLYTRVSLHMLYVVTHHSRLQH